MHTYMYIEGIRTAFVQKNKKIKLKLKLNKNKKLNKKLFFLNIRNTREAGK